MKQKKRNGVVIIRPWEAGSEGSVVLQRKGTTRRRGIIAFENTMKSTFIRTPLNHEISTTTIQSAQTLVSHIFAQTSLLLLCGGGFGRRGERLLSCSLFTTMTTGIDVFEEGRNAMKSNEMMSAVFMFKSCQGIVNPVTHLFLPCPVFTNQFSPVWVRTTTRGCRSIVTEFVCPVVF